MSFVKNGSKRFHQRDWLQIFHNPDGLWVHRPTARWHILPSQSRAKQNLATINYACFLIFQVEHKLNWSFVRFIFIARLLSVSSLSTSFFLPIEIIEFVNFFISHSTSSFSSQIACTKHNKHNKSIFDVFSSTLLRFLYLLRFGRSKKHYMR